MSDTGFAGLVFGFAVFVGLVVFLAIAFFGIDAGMDAIDFCAREGLEAVESVTGYVCVEGVPVP